MIMMMDGGLHLVPNFLDIHARLQLALEDDNCVVAPLVTHPWLALSAVVQVKRATPHASAPTTTPVRRMTARQGTTMTTTMARTVTLGERGNGHGEQDAATTIRSWRNRAQQYHLTTPLCRQHAPHSGRLKVDRETDERNSVMSS